MNRSFIARVIVDCVILLAIFEGWWFVALPMALFGSWEYPYFMEIIAAGFIYDSLFSLGAHGVQSWTGTIAAILGYAVMRGLKRIVRK